VNICFLSGNAMKAGHGSMNYLRSLGRCDREFESHLGHGCLVCIGVYSVFVLSCV
jgi:hypothetical protein